MKRCHAAFLLGVICLCFSGCPVPSSPTISAQDDLGSVGDFSLTERSGRMIRASDLEGKVWIAAFVFTRCAGPCTRVSGVMARLQHDLADAPDVMLVSYTVDPEYDTPSVLRDYAERFGADPKRWLFLTGDPKIIYRLIREQFHLTAQPNEGAERTPGNEVMHDTRLVVVDRHGHIRGYFQATEEDAIGRLEDKVRALMREKP